MQTISKQNFTLFFLSIIFLFPISTITHNILLKAIPVIIFATFFGIYILENSKLKLRINYFYLVILTILSVGMIRNNNPLASPINAAFKILTIFLYIYVFLRQVKIDSEQKMTFGLIAPFLSLSLVSILLKVLNISFGDLVSLDLGLAVVLSNLGININRIAFPLTGGINSYTSVLGGLLTLSTLALIFLSKRKVFYLFVAITFSIQLLLLDSRGPIMFSIIAILVSYFVQKWRKFKFVFSIPIVSIIAPFLFIIGIMITNIFFEENAFQRNSYEMESGNSRLIIWLISIEEFANFKTTHLFGYGEFGHFKSGASELWSSQFSAFQDSNMIHPHNTNLSILYDYGYVGLMTYTIFLFYISKRLYKNLKLNTPLATILFGFFFYCTLINSTETFISFYYLNAFNLVLICTLLLFIDKRKT